MSSIRTCSGRLIEPVLVCLCRLRAALAKGGCRRATPLPISLVASLAPLARLAPKRPCGGDARNARKPKEKQEGQADLGLGRSWNTETSVI